jgi:hypothetical protein
MVSMHNIMFTTACTCLRTEAENEEGAKEERRGRFER